MADVTAIKDQDTLKTFLVDEQKARIEAEKKADLAAAKLVEMEKQAKEDRDKLAEVMSKNWTNKYNSNDTKEETLYNMGKFIKAMVTHNGEDLEKYGVGGGKLSGDQEKSFGSGGYNITKAPTLGTPLYSDATTGSYLVPVEYAAEVLRIGAQVSQMRGKVREVPMSGITKYVPIAGTGVSMSYQTLQSSAKSQVNPTFDRVTLTSQTGAMWTSIVDELQEDSLVNLAAYYSEIFGEQEGYDFDYQCTSSNADPFTGLLNGAGNSLGLGAGQTSFQDIKFDDLYDAIGKLTTENKRTGASWMMHCTVFDILRKIKDANGNYLYQKPEGSQPGTLCGYPYILTDGMVSTASDDVSTKFIAFGNPKHFLFGNRVGMEFKIFDNTVYRMSEDMIYFRARVRRAFTTGIVGAFVAVSTAAS